MQLLSKDHGQNLIKLAEYILNNVSDKQFNMEHFRSDTYGEYADFISFGNCGTVGCALGWAPFALTEAEPSTRVNLRKEFLGMFSDVWVSGNRSADYDKMALELFGIPYNSLAWGYLFSAEWAHRVHDGSREGFAERVAIYLENPEMFRWKRALVDGEFQWEHY